jgi:hypothetical protein
VGGAQQIFQTKLFGRSRHFRKIFFHRRPPARRSPAHPPTHATARGARSYGSFGLEHNKQAHFYFIILLELEPHYDHEKHGIYKPSFAEEI